MTNKINELTKEQWDSIPDFREKYLAMVTGPTDVEKLTEGLSDAYEIMGRKTPEIVLVPSPMAAMKTIAYLKNQPLKANFNCLWGTHDLYWIAHYLFCAEIGARYDDETFRRLKIMEKISTQCEWWWPFEDKCIVSRKPVDVHWDDEKRLHNESGAAVLYSDQYSMCCWHGLRVPRPWILDKSLTAEEALTQENAELRRAACEILGWANVLEHESLSPKIIDEDKDPEIGTLISVNLPEAEDQWFLKIRCGTGRWFAEPVNDKQYNTALKANAAGNGWRIDSGDDPEQFIPVIRT